ncbi:hypothetical protein FVEG_07954 [Fusarium verticillioides 7600]|uniref:Uncharacterized protein n=1 Tax=Gibberella moniliformis (strain M3125 / FGSC 7600) TaxID=334819 RepID=W7MK99_GIBM7|nr:hypothetical protein FVEG_07954 [Fusarium verticillioides 7600]EWG48015.1 hypothetical protein FVEG_07954 [Fusarium verticillioides 7600]
MPDAHGNRVAMGKKIQIGRLRLEKASGAVKVDRGSAKMVKLGPIGTKIDCSCLLDVVRRRRFGRNTTETRVPICPSGNAIEGLISLTSGCE